MDSPRPSRRRLAFLIGMPLAWAVLLLFHSAPDPDDLYGSLRDEVTKWQVVHLGTLVFIGLIGAALYLLVKDLPGRAARISRLAIGPFVLFYGAGEAILGVATGVLVQHANDVPAEREGGRRRRGHGVMGQPDLRRRPHHRRGDRVGRGDGRRRHRLSRCRRADVSGGAAGAFVDRRGACATRRPGRPGGVRHRRGPTRTRAEPGAGRSHAGTDAGGCGVISTICTVVSAWSAARTA